MWDGEGQEEDRQSKVCKERESLGERQDLSPWGTLQKLPRVQARQSFVHDAGVRGRTWPNPPNTPRPAGAACSCTCHRSAAPKEAHGAPSSRRELDRTLPGPQPITETLLSWRLPEGLPQPSLVRRNHWLPPPARNRAKRLGGTGGAGRGGLTYQPRLRGCQGEWGGAG